MRIRTVKPSFWTSETIALLSEHGALLALALINYADDEGYFSANVALIKAALFPIRESFTAEALAKEMASLVQIQYIELRKASDGRSYGRIVNFSAHQVINKAKPSRIAPIWEQSETVKSPKKDESRSDTGSIPDDSRGNGRKGMEGEGNGTEVKTSSSCPESSTPDLLLVDPDPGKNAEGLRFAHWFLATLQGFAPCAVKVDTRTLDDILDLPHQGYAKSVIRPDGKSRKQAATDLGKKLDGWVDVYDKLIRLDRRKPGEISAVCKWARGHKFWGQNFLSPAKLRENDDGIKLYDRLLLKMQTPEAASLPDNDGIKKEPEKW